MLCNFLHKIIEGDTKKVIVYCFPELWAWMVLNIVHTNVMDIVHQLSLVLLLWT